MENMRVKEYKVLGPGKMLPSAKLKRRVGSREAARFPTKATGETTERDAFDTIDPET